MAEQPLPPALTASYTPQVDDGGPYFEIRMGGRMIAYCDDQASAEMIVSALNTCNRAVAKNLGEQGSTYAN